MYRVETSALTVKAARSSEILLHIYQTA